MSKYEMIIYWSDEDQSFVTEVPELPGCMGDGPTYREAVANTERIIERVDSDRQGTRTRDSVPVDDCGMRNP